MKKKNSIKSVLLSIIVLGFIFGSMMSLVPEIKTIETTPKLYMEIIR